MNKCDKNVKEISAASIQKDLLTLEEQEVCLSPHFSIPYNTVFRSVPGKHPWMLKHNSQFWATWAFTREWALARNTTVSTLRRILD